MIDAVGTGMTTYIIRRVMLKQDWEVVAAKRSDNEWLRMSAR
jgi:hypothetical protein